jgi:ParB family chromosome partitioning protein
MKATVQTGTVETPVETPTPPASYVEQAGQILKRIPLSAIALDPLTDVRKGPLAKDEAAKIDSLAKSIIEQGQLQPIVVRPNGSGETYLLVAGRRRLAACQLIEEKFSEREGRPVTFDIEALIVEKNDEESWVAAIQENLQRKNFSPLELAQNIADIRERKTWNGKDWSKRVADFLHISRATVTTHIGLLEMPEDIQAKVHRGELSAQSAFDLYDIQKNRDVQTAEKVLARAEKLAEEEAAETPGRMSSKGKGAASESKTLGTSAKGTVESTGDGQNAPETGKVKRKHVLAAAREAEVTTKPRTRNEILGFFQEVLDSTDPYPQPIVDFCKVFVSKWAAGVGGDRSLLNKLDIIAEALSPETPKKAKGKKA